MTRETDGALPLRYPAAAGTVVVSIIQMLFISFCFYVERAAPGETQQLTRTLPWIYTLAAVIVAAGAIYGRKSFKHNPLKLLFIAAAVVQMGLMLTAQQWPKVLAIAAMGVILILRGVNVARPIAAVPLIALGIWILFLRGRDLKKGRDWLRWGLFLALLLAVYRPTGALWDAHVQQVTGYEPAGIPGYNFYVGFNEDTRGMYSEEDMETFGRVLNEEAGGQPKAGQQAMFALAAERIRSLSGKLPRLLLSKWKVFLADDQAAVFYYGTHIPENLRGLGNLICNTWYYTVILLALAGAWRLWRRREQGSILTAPLFVLGLSLAQMLVEVSGRYHYSALPMLVLLAACAGGAELRSETGEG